MSNLSGHGQLTGIINQGAGGGGGGSTVVINPTGEAIGTMEKISVDGNIYDVRNVPDATSATNGNILTKTASGVGWYPPTKELPTHTSGDNNKVLTIENDVPSWKNVPKELPTHTSADNGKVLGIDNNLLSWLPQGGGYTETVLFEETESTYVGIKELSDNISNYDELIFRSIYENSQTTYEQRVTTSLIEKIGYIQNPTPSSKHISLEFGYDQSFYRMVRGENDNELNIFQVIGTRHVVTIIGVKYKTIR